MAAKNDHRMAVSVEINYRWRTEIPVVGIGPVHRPKRRAVVGEGYQPAPSPWADNLDVAIAVEITRGQVGVTRHGVLGSALWIRPHRQIRTILAADDAQHAVVDEVAVVAGIGDEDQVWGIRLIDLAVAVVVMHAHDQRRHHDLVVLRRQRSTRPGPLDHRREAPGVGLGKAHRRRCSEIVGLADLDDLVAAIRQDGYRGVPERQFAGNRHLDRQGLADRDRVGHACGAEQRIRTAFVGTVLVHVVEGQDVEAAGCGGGSNIADGDLQRSAQLQALRIGMSRALRVDQGDGQIGELLDCDHGPETYLADVSLLRRSQRYAQLLGHIAGAGEGQVGIGDGDTRQREAADGVCHRQLSEAVHLLLAGTEVLAGLAIRRGPRGSIIRVLKLPVRGRIRGARLVGRNAVLDDLDRGAELVTDPIGWCSQRTVPPRLGIAIECVCRSIGGRILAAGNWRSANRLVGSAIGVAELKVGDHALGAAGACDVDTPIRMSARAGLDADGCSCNRQVGGRVDHDTSDAGRVCPGRRGAARV